MDMINKFDIDGDGMVSFPEFLQMMAPNEDDYQKDIAEVVQMFDTNNNGYMDLTEIENILLRFGNGGEGPPKGEDLALIHEMMDEFKTVSGWTAEYHYFKTQDAINLLAPDMVQEEQPADPQEVSTDLTDRPKHSQKNSAQKRQSSFALGAGKKDSKKGKGGIKVDGKQINLKDFCSNNLMQESSI